MGFNFGAFAGGLAKGGMDTYTAMKSIERQDEELKLRKQEVEFRAEQAAREREAYAETQGLRTAAKETYGAVGKPQTFVGGEMGPVPEGAPQYSVDLAKQDVSPYTEAQAGKDYLAKARAINPEKAAVAEATQLGLSTARRTEGYAKRQETALGFNQNVLADLATNNGDIGAVLNKHFIPLYNENKLPGVADGGTAKVVQNAVGGGSSIVITGKDGKDSVMPADIKTLQMLTGKVQDLMMSSSSPENYWKGKEQAVKEGTLKAQQTSADAAASNAATSSRELEQKISAGLFGAQAGLAKAQAGQATAHAALYNNMVTMAKEKTAAGEALKPFIEDFAKLTPEEQQGSKGQQILTEGALAAAKKSGDVTGLIAQLKKPDRSVVSAEMEKSAMEEYRGATTPAQIAAVKLKYPGVFGPSALDTAIAARAKGNAAPVAAAPVAAPAQAIPTGDRAELKSQASLIESEIAKLRTSVGLKSPPAERAAAGAKIEALQTRRAAILDAWARTPSAIPVEKMPMAQP
jgi:hypothetical protein